MKMPRGDGTGPAGLGPMTGRAAGYCAGYNAPGYANPIPRRGMGFSRGFRGRGFGWRRWNFIPDVAIEPVTQPYPAESVNLNKEQEKKILEAEKAEIEAELKAVEKRLKELK